MHGSLCADDINIVVGKNQASSRTMPRIIDKTLTHNAILAPEVSKDDENIEISQGKVPKLIQRGSSELLIRRGSSELKPTKSIEAKRALRGDILTAKRIKTLASPHQRVDNE
jgi:hypothetical protein